MIITPNSNTKLPRIGTMNAKRMSAKISAVSAKPRNI